MRRHLWDKFCRICNLDIRTDGRLNVDYKLFNYNVYVPSIINWNDIVKYIIKSPHEKKKYDVHPSEPV